MKNKIKFLSIAMLMLAMTSVVIGRANYQMSFQNQSSYYMGVATVTQQSSGNVYVNITGGGSFPFTVTSNPTGAVINGYVTQPGTVGYAYFMVGSTNHKVSVDFTSSVIVVQDQSIIQ